eukprot:CAMPEP_0178516860 /NCGR_PEP_ID=MMETSP0696-20121128/25360_1 /TAXON_ID=265572 /ORGANISM="Extubocellulus spinifer, Strain CCMP396" /LENGTH=638 /DNA_ID=CAMNT_0020147207 /DNA_START=116 /DNA_END=2032 /DNA_ORIENTATION=+
MAATLEAFQSPNAARAGGGRAIQLGIGIGSSSRHQRHRNRDHTSRRQVFNPTNLYLADLGGSSQNDASSASSSSERAVSDSAESSDVHVDTTSVSHYDNDRTEAIGDDFTSTVATTDTTATATALPKRNHRGMYEIETQEQHAALLAAHPDKLVVMKFFANFCQACKALAPRYLAVRNDRQLEGLPIIWAEFISNRSNKEFFRSLGILSLPTIHFYDGSNGLVENFPCGPAKIPLLKKKLATFLNDRVDPETLKLRKVEEPKASRLADAPRRDRAVSSIEAYNIITDEHLEHLRSLSFFSDLNDDEFDGMLKTARLQTFLPGDVIVRQGELRHTFFVVKTGVVEMSIKSRFEDPITTPPNYLGAVVAELKEFDFFGERACTTGQPYAASFKVLEKTRCFAFNAEDIPPSSILSMQRRATREIIEKLDERYELPEDYTPPFLATPKQDADILDLLMRFKQIRQVAKGFEYVMQTSPKFGDEGEIARRSLLVSRLSKSQLDEFKEAFSIADVNKDNRLSLLEMRKFMESAGAAKTDEQLTEMINKARMYDPVSGGYADAMTLNEFMGVMAEAEFYNLLTETFQTLDEGNTGYVRAGDLNVMLGGVRDIIGGDHKSIIDVEDEDVQVDYEQYSKMLLGATL